MRAGPLVGLAGLAVLVVIAAPASAQEPVCGGDSPPPTCSEPQVTVQAPAGATVAGGGTVSVTLNVTFASSVPGPLQMVQEPSTITVSAAETNGLSATGQDTDVTPGQTVAVPVTIAAAAGAVAGDHTLTLLVNTTATDQYRSSSQDIPLVVQVPIRVAGFQATPNTVRQAGAGHEVEIRVTLTANGPVDVAVTVVEGADSVDPVIIPTSANLTGGGSVDLVTTLMLAGAGGDVTLAFTPTFRGQPVEGVEASSVTFDAPAGGFPWLLILLVLLIIVVIVAVLWKLGKLPVGKQPENPPGEEPMGASEGYAEAEPAPAPDTTEGEPERRQ